MRPGMINNIDQTILTFLEVISNMSRYHFKNRL